MDQKSVSCSIREFRCSLQHFIGFSPNMDQKSVSCSITEFHCSHQPFIGFCPNICFNAPNCWTSSWLQL